MGRPVLSYVINAVRRLSPARLILIVGFMKEEIFAQLKGESYEYAVQAEPLGTGHAVLSACGLLGGHDGDVLILCGDVPFLSSETLQTLLEQHRSNNAMGTVLTAEVENPTGYGRIKRNGNGSVAGIMEELNASPEERTIHEINSGVYVFRCKKLFDLLGRLKPDPVKGEYYLTDVVKLAVGEGVAIGAYRTPNPEETIGINSFEDMKKAEEFLQRHQRATSETRETKDVSRDA